jgi:hypothetical protein
VEAADHRHAAADRGQHELEQGEVRQPAVNRANDSCSPSACGRANYVTPDRVSAGADQAARSRIRAKTNLPSVARWAGLIGTNCTAQR